jgi:hypothetical protein|mmetsp:Transcript_13418/g.22067  ORF Transcript_13418/g.22067 Transcript_13418/m.22067 type:complete len:598 (+) Transcript_13418:48-1841(+)
MHMVLGVVRVFALLCLVKYFGCNAGEYGQCSDAWEIDADSEDVFEVNLLQTHVALGSPATPRLQVDSKLHLSSETPQSTKTHVLPEIDKLEKEPAAVATKPVVAKSDPPPTSAVKDDFVHLLQTELELLPSEDVQMNHSAAWMFVSGACLFTMFALWYEIKIQGIGEDAQDSKTSGSANEANSRILSPMVIEIPLKVRDDRWDFIRLVLIWALIGTHLVGSIRFEAGLYLGDTYPGLAAHAFSGLVFLSGMFSSSPEAKPVMMTLVGLPATIFLLGALTWATSTLTLGRQDNFEIGRSMAECYLTCMFLWRLTVPPLFHCCDLCRAPKSIAFSLVCAASWILASPASHVQDPLVLHFAAMPKIYLHWNMLICSAPFFAAGMMLTPQRWSELMDQRSLTFAAYVTLTTFALAEMWLGLHGLLHPQNFYALRTAMMFCVVFASTFVIGSWIAPLKAILPRVAEHVIGCSRRSCQAFNFHWALFVLPGGRLGFPVFAGEFSRVGARSQAVIICLTSLWLTLVLSSQFTEYLCGWLLNLPIKLVEVLSNYIDGKSKASQKAFEAFEPIYFRKEAQSSTTQKTIAFCNGGHLMPSEPILSGA